jgi:tRNA(fMet)-specific endonuclease VapC
MLDTNICIDMLRSPSSRAFKHILKLEVGDVGISTITLAELEYGVNKSSDPAKNTALLIEACSVFEIADFDNEAAACYGLVRSSLELKGMSIGPLDTLIGAHALSLGVTLVTSNMREFKRIKGLELENWLRN